MPLTVNRYFGHKTRSVLHRLRLALRSQIVDHWCDASKLNCEETPVCFDSVAESQSLKTIVDGLCLAQCVHIISACIKIQRWYRRRRCCNDTDPITMERIVGPAFILVDNTKGCRYKFDPMTLYNYLRSSIKFENPLTRVPLTLVEIKRLERMIDRLQSKIQPKTKNHSDPSVITANFGGNTTNTASTARNAVSTVQNRTNTGRRGRISLPRNEADMSLYELYLNADHIKRRRVEEANFKIAQDLQNSMEFEFVPFESAISSFMPFGPFARVRHIGGSNINANAIKQPEFFSVSLPILQDLPFSRVFFPQISFSQGSQVSRRARQRPPINRQVSSAQQLHSLLSALMML